MVRNCGQLDVKKLVSVVYRPHWHCVNSFNSLLQQEDLEKPVPELCHAWAVYLVPRLHALLAQLICPVRFCLLLSSHCNYGEFYVRGTQLVRK